MSVNNTSQNGAAPARIAMLGGTFDPVHLGHLRSAVELLETLSLDRVHLVPAHVPPHRQAPGVCAEQRLAMLAAGVGDTPGLIVDDRELQREGPSYSADSLASLREACGADARLVMVIGHDAFLKLDSWHRPERVFELAHVVVIDRPGHEAAISGALRELIGQREVSTPQALFDLPAGRLLRIGLPTRLAISATAIRQRLKEGRSVRYLLPEAVEAFIQRQGLYQGH